MGTAQWNGWQRLWVVLGIVTLVLAVVRCWALGPTREEIYREWASDQWGEVGKIPRLAGEAYREFEAGMQEPTDSAVVDRLNLNASPSRIASLKAAPTSDSFLVRALEHVNTIRPDYEKRLASLAEARALFWAEVVGGWAGVMAVLYLAGWSMGWISRGFGGT